MLVCRNLGCCKVFRRLSICVEDRDPTVEAETEQALVLMDTHEQDRLKAHVNDAEVDVKSSQRDLEETKAARDDSFLINFATLVNFHVAMDVDASSARRHGFLPICYQLFAYAEDLILSIQPTMTSRCQDGAASPDVVPEPGTGTATTPTTGTSSAPKESAELPEAKQQEKDTPNTDKSGNTIRGNDGTPLSRALSAEIQELMEKECIALPERQSPLLQPQPQGDASSGGGEETQGEPRPSSSLRAPAPERGDGGGGLTPPAPPQEPSRSAEPAEAEADAHPGPGGSSSLPGVRVDGHDKGGCEGKDQKAKEDAPMSTDNRWAATPRTMVTSVRDAFDFWDNCLDVLCHEKDEDESLEVLTRLETSLKEDSCSSAFSGVLAPETGVNMLRYRLGQRLGREVCSENGHLGHMIEWNNFSQQECLLIGKQHGCCLFSDIGQFYHPELKQEVIPALMEKPSTSLQVLTPLIMSNRASVTNGHCLVHSKTCCLKSCKRHIAGTSCRPFSRRGAQLGVFDKDFLYTLSWVSLRRVLQEADVTMENVPSFPVKIIQNLLGDMYHLESVNLCSTSFGVPAARPRQFIRLRHKVKILEELSPISRFAQRFYRAVKFHWEECLG